jgi:hypothetical protein
LQRGGLRSSGSNNDTVFHRVVLLKRLDKLGDSGSFLANGDVDTVELLGLIVSVVPSSLVQHGIEGDGSLSGLSITDDQFSLTTTDGHHGVDRLETSLYWLVDGSSGQDTGSLELSTSSLGCFDRTLAIDGVAEGINNTTQHSLANWNIDLDHVITLLKWT